MSEIESAGGMLQLFDSPAQIPTGLAMQTTAARPGYGEVLAGHPEGNCTTANGNHRYMADVTLMEMPLDVSKLSLRWVTEIDDKLFAELTATERAVLYLHFHEEQTWKQIGMALGCDEQTARSRLDTILEKVRFAAGLP